MTGTRSKLNFTHDPDRKSWVEAANAPDTDFPIQNLPFGIFHDGRHQRAGVAIGDQIMDIVAAVQAGLFEGQALEAANLASGPNLNALIASDPKYASALRARLSDLLWSEGPESSDAKHTAAQILIPVSRVEMRLPAQIGSFSDFYTSIYHTERGGRFTRPDNPVPLAFKYLPIAYNSRATSIRPSGTAMRRPNVQRRKGEQVEFGPCEQLDFELELAIFIGQGNSLGESITIDRAMDHIFGLCLLNDWSARDTQIWESILGPFLSKNMHTTISPWIVTTEALAPFRVPAAARPDGDPPPLPYLHSASDLSDGGLDIRLDAYLQTAQMRSQGSAGVRITRTNFKYMYWTFAQMLTHHTSNGCNLQPADLLGSGTTSGPTDESRACFNELTDRGTRVLTLPNGEARRYLEDGDEVTFRGRAEREGFVPIGFGECLGRVEPAKAGPGH